MSDGSVNYPLRTSHPSAPTLGRVKEYNYDDGAGTIQPFYMLSDGVPRTKIGAQGIQGDDGIQGPIGPQGIQGIQGPVGPVELVATDTLTTAITLPNTTGFTLARTFNWTAPSTGRYIITGHYNMRPHSAGNDYKWEWDADNAVISPVHTEEGKDTSAAQSHPRPLQYDLGILNAGAHVFEWYFAKETTGGTAQLKYISMFIWKVS